MEPSHGLRQTNERLELPDSVAVRSSVLAARALPQLFVLGAEDFGRFSRELRSDCAADLDVGLKLSHGELWL